MRALLSQAKLSYVKVFMAMLMPTSKLMYKRPSSFAKPTAFSRAVPPMHGATRFL